MTSVVEPDGIAAAIASDVATGPVAFVGIAGSGKTTALVRRAARLAGERAEPASAVVLASANRRATAAFAAAEPVAGVVVKSLEEIAADVLRAARFATHLSPDLAIIPEARAARVFEEIGAALFSLDWTEFVSPEIDPEITGLRSPQRFAAAAFRLVRRLRSAGIDPAKFHTTCLQGATEFYGRTPNLGNPDLKTATKPEDRDSLLVGPEELERQRSRELDLERILSRLYASYVASLVAEGCLTESDALVEAAELLARQPRLAERLRARYPRAAIDDAQDLTQAHLTLLRAWFGEPLAGVTFAGDARQRTRAFSGSLGEAVFRGAAETFVFDAWLRGRAAIGNVALRGVDPRFSAPSALPAAPASAGESAAARPAVAFARARDVDDEARIVAEFVVEALAGGTPAAEIAIVTRTLGSAPPYLEALLARDVVCDLAGDGSAFVFPAAQDALGALWALADPFRHDYLLRNLEAPWMRLADASIARLCAEPSQPQTPLFELPEEPSETRNRWDRRRDFRLARNVTRGDADLDLTPVARERLERFRATLARWERLEFELDLPALVRRVAGETVLATLPPGARGAFATDTLARLFAYVDAFAAARPLATLHDLLEEIDAIADRDEALLAIDRVRDDAVAVLDVDAAKGREFALVLVVDVRAGAFPRYYVPESFVYTPKLGIVAKENVGDAPTARTAKFTYAMFRTKAQDGFLADERRAFYVAASRARERLVVTASGRATQGRAAPEILEELRRAGLPGTADLTR